MDVLKKVANIIAGEEGVNVVRSLIKAGEATDDELATMTELKLKEVRKILFKLYNHSIVQCNVGRDEDTGWFIFHWKLQPDQIEGYLKNQKRRILKILKTRLEYETSNEFYYCFNPECNRYTFEDSMELVFHCPTCNGTLKYYDNRKIIEALKKRIKKLEE